jgi:hypothetical protein
VEGESGVEDAVRADDGVCRMCRLKPLPLSALVSTTGLLLAELLLRDVSRLSMERGRWKTGRGAITTSGSCKKGKVNQVIKLPEKRFSNTFPGADRISICVGGQMYMSVNISKCPFYLTSHLGH